MHQGHLPSPAGSWKTSRGGSGLYADGSTSTAHKQQPNKHQDQYNNHRVKRSARETSYDDRRKGQDGVGRGDTVLGSKRSGTERLRTKGLKDRDPRVGGKRSACNGIRSAQAGKTRVGRHGLARTKRYAIWNWSARQGKITRLKD